MKLGTVALILALVTAPACGGGGGSDTDPGGSPGPLSASFIPDLEAPGSNTVAMAQGPRANDIVDVYVTLTGTSGVYGAALDVVFDDAHAAFIGYTKGAAFEQGGDVPNYLVDGTNLGRIVIGVSRTGGTTTNIIGSKAMVTLKFRVKNAGTFPMSVQNGAVYDGQGTPQPIAGISWYAGALQGV